MNEEMLKALYQIFDPSLPRLAPGDNLSTRRALTALFGSSPPRPGLQVLDIGCGNGAQSLRLVAELGCHVTAVDIHAPYLAELERRAAAQGLAGRITTHCADMIGLDLEGRTFDLVWAEGSAFVVGIAEALATWHKFLTPGGALGFSDLLWLRDDAPAECHRYFGEEYPAISNVATIRQLIADHGWDLVDDFALPESSWLQEFYDHLSRHLDEVEPHLSADEAATTMAAMCRREIAMYRKYSRYYGYVFFTARKRG
jgi:cyclopropane fatty-acyl-phospholipid synthase-like methyltransferase